MHTRPRIKTYRKGQEEKKKTNLKENQKFHDIMTMHFEFPYPFFRGYEFTLIKRIKKIKEEA
jgi:hypothetical protein